MMDNRISITCSTCGYVTRGIEHDDVAEGAAAHYEETGHNSGTLISDGQKSQWAIAGPTKTREGDQPLPTTNDEPYVADALKDFIEARKQIGIQRYGTPLQSNNGRDALRDAFEEAVDLATYLAQVIIERDGHL